MKTIQKKILTMALIAASSTSFAQSSSYGVTDTQSFGSVEFTGRSVGSCTAPTVNVSLGNIDFHTAKNGVTGVYEHQVDLAVTCTNPNQTWLIGSYVASFNFASGVNGGVSESAFVSINGVSAVPGAVFDMAGATSQWGSQAYNENYDILTAGRGMGTATVQAKLVFGKSMPDNTVYDVKSDFNSFNTGVPSVPLMGVVLFL